MHTPSKIRNLDLTTYADKQILGLDITVNDVL